MGIKTHFEEIDRYPVERFLFLFCTGRQFKVTDE